MEAKTEIEYKQAYILTPAAISKIWVLLQNVVGSVKATAICEDKIERQFTNLEELTNYENSRLRGINKLDISAKSSDLNETAYINFRSSLPSISLRAEGAEPNITSLKDTFTEIADGMRAWYSPITRIDLFLVVVIVGWFAFMILNSMSGHSRSSTGMTFHRALVIAFIVAGIFIGLGLTIWGLIKAHRRFFPVATFAVGQGETRHEIDEKYRWAVIVGFVISAFASLVIALII